MTHVYKSDTDKQGDEIQLVQSPWNSNHFAIMNRSTNEYTAWSDIEDYAEAYKKFRFLVEKEKNDVWQG